MLEKASSPRRRKLFPCEVCSKYFSTKQILKDHSDALHSESPVYKCDNCSKQFWWRSDYRKHSKACIEINDGGKRINSDVETGINDETGK